MHPCLEVGSSSKFGGMKSCLLALGSLGIELDEAIALAFVDVPASIPTRNKDARYKGKEHSDDDRLLRY